MDIEKLIDGLKNSKGPDNCHDSALGYWALMGATALSTLQAENEKLRTGLNKAPECERCQEIKGERQMYINACEQIKSLQALLQKRNEILQHKDNEIKQLRDELKQVKQERDEAIKTIFKWTGCPECGFENIGRGNFCQNCGCLYTDDAVEIVMKRLEDIYALHND